MVDFYWLKSFTEIVQLFISVIFLIFLKIKYKKRSSILHWFRIFLTIKVFEDFYGVINYTSWIEEILTPEVLDYYRVFMFSLDYGLLASFYLFVICAYDLQRRNQIRDYISFLPAILAVPFNLFLVVYHNSNLVEMFLLLRLAFIFTLLFLWLKKNVEFLRLLLVTMLLWNTIWFLEVFLHEYLHVIKESLSWILFIVSEIIFMIGITYFLIQVIADPKILRQESIDDLLPPNLKLSIEKKLKKGIDENKLYRDPELSLNKLADQLGIQANDLTLYLNRILKVNFNKYISSLRIEESIRLLKNNDNLSIEQVMHQVGFNSKSVFNTAFKNKTGMTPSAFRNSVRSQTN